VAARDFGLGFDEARVRAPGSMLLCRAFRFGGQKSSWLVSAADLAELIASGGNAQGKGERRC